MNSKTIRKARWNDYLMILIGMGRSWYDLHSLGDSRYDMNSEMFKTYDILFESFSSLALSASLSYMGVAQNT